MVVASHEVLPFSAYPPQKRYEGFCIFPWDCHILHGISLGSQRFFMYIIAGSPLELCLINLLKSGTTSQGLILIEAARRSKARGKPGILRF